MRYKIIVQEGQIYLKCIDPFEDILQLSKETVKGMELTDILEPNMFDNHKEIVDALFEVFFDLGTQYCEQQYYSRNEIREQAEKKVRQKYKLDEISDSKDVM